MMDRFVRTSCVFESTVWIRSGLVAACLMCFSGSWAQTGTASSVGSNSNSTTTNSSIDSASSINSSGPVRLQSSRRNNVSGSSKNTDSGLIPDTGDEEELSTQDDIVNWNEVRRTESGNPSASNGRGVQSAPRDEFELYLKRLGYSRVKRFGSDLVTGRGSFDVAETSGAVPADYVIGVNDELQVTLWGSVDADLRVQVDRSGRIVIPRVGTILVAGVKYADLSEVISKRVGQVFRNFQLSVSLSQVRSVRVYVTGNVKRPGVYTVSALSSVLNALMKSGGPAHNGSFRQIELKRGAQSITRYDLYELLLRGDRSADRVVQNGDVIHVAPVGAQVAIVGSVNQPAIFEIKATENVKSLLEMAGGFSSVADRSRLAIEKLEDRSKNRITQINLPDDERLSLGSGDVLRAFSAVEVAQPVARQNKRVRIEGEVSQPGEYVIAPGATLRDAVNLAGGLTVNAYVYGAEFTRESVRIAQQINYDRALRDMETEFSRATATQRAINADEAATFEQRNTATSRLIEKLRQVRPNGRIVWQLKPDAAVLPDLPLEDGDRLVIPSRPTTVSVFGSVFSSGAFLLEPGKTLNDFLSQAGGPTKGADPDSVFVIRPNGSVLSQLQRSSFFGLIGNIGKIQAEPGDTIFVPEMMNKTTWVQNLKEWTQIMYQFGIGAAALKTLSN